MKKFREFAQSLNEGVKFEHDPNPHVVVPTQDRFGKARYDVKNRHDWQNEIIKSHTSHGDAQAHVDSLNKAHREKHNIKEDMAQ